MPGKPASATAMAFLQDETSFYVIRFLLGARKQGPT